MNKEFLKACERGETETAAILLDNGAKGRVEALKLASENGNTETLDMLLDRGIDVNIKNSWGFTALMELCFLRCGYEQATEGATLLLDRGADVNVKTKKERSLCHEGTTALMLASRCEYTDFVNILLERGADVNAKDRYGFTALKLASQNGNTEIVNILLDRGADVLAVDKYGDTALSVANKNGYTEIVKLINHYRRIELMKQILKTALIIKKGLTQKEDKPLMPSAHRETIYRIACFF